MGGYFGSEQGKGLRRFRPGKNADINEVDGLNGMPVFKLPTETPDDYKFWCGVAEYPHQFFGVLSQAVDYGMEDGKVWDLGQVPARVKAAATALPGAYLAWEGGSTAHFFVSAHPTGIVLVTDLSGESSGTIYGPDNVMSDGNIPEVIILEGAKNQVNWSGPATLDADGIAQAQAVGGAGNLTLNGALASGGVATLLPPRNVTILSAGNDSGITFTVTGTNILGESISETITGANAGTATGNLAFATVTQIAASGAAAGNVSAGSGDKLGLPFASAVRLAEVTFFNGAVEGTAVTLAKDADEIEKNTADPNSALDGSQLGIVFYER